MDETRTTSGASEEANVRVEALMELTYQLIALEDSATLGRVLNQERAADLADLFRRLDEEMRDPVFDLLDEQLAPEVLAELDTPTALSIIEEMDHQELSSLMEDMAPDDAADMLADMEEGEAEKVLSLMEVGEAQDLQDLMAHEEDTGGGIMTPKLVLVDEASSVADVIGVLRGRVQKSDVMNLFVVDAEEKLKGIVPLHRLVTALPDTPISDLMDRDTISVTTETDQEEIAQIFSRYNLLAMPVVNEEGRVVGQITVDDVVDVIHEEATEDIYKMAGTSDEEMERPSILGVVRARLPWLLICLLGSFFPGP